MKAIVVSEPGGPEVLKWKDTANLRLGPYQLLVKVKAVGVNRADLLQRKGLYPPPPGESDVLGLEVAGMVEQAGDRTKFFEAGDRVFGLVGGGAYATHCLIDYRMAIPIPREWEYVQAAAVPEVFFTANETLFQLGGLKAGERVLIHAGGSGVGSTAVQMARMSGAEVYVTAGSQEKIARCVELGAKAGINYKEKDFAESILERTNGEGVDLVEDFIGASYFERNLRVLRRHGRLVLIGLLGGAKTDVNLGIILTKRLKLMGFVMRSSRLDEKIAITDRFRARWLPRLVEGQIAPVIDKTFPLKDAAAAHTYMENAGNFGKVVLVEE